MIQVGIVGGSGYTGVELLRILARHPKVNVKVITSRAEQGKSVAELFPNLRGHYDIHFTAPDSKALSACDVVFFATPHGVAQSLIPALIDKGCRVIDLSADFRIKDKGIWERWYGQAHGSPQLLSMAVYGLPERNREQIKNAQLIACPGCYPTSIQLGLLPLLENDLVDPTKLVANSASGISGAGRQATLGNLFAETNDNFRAYSVQGHRHLPEIEQGLREMQSGLSEPAQLTFVPHLLPIVRGIHSTLYANLTAEAAPENIQALYQQRYADEHFVDVLPAGVFPETRTVKGTNICTISVIEPQERGMVVVMSVIDNLVKGASGQGVQNMNIMFGFKETAGLDTPALLP